MNKILLIFTLFVFGAIVQIGFCQTIQKRIDIAQSNLGFGITEAKDGALYIVGQFDSNWVGREPFVMKMNKVGNVLWTKAFYQDYAGPWENAPFAITTPWESIIQTDDNALVVASRTTTDDLYTRPTMTKYDSNGIVIWSRYFGRMNDFTTSLIQSNDNGFVTISSGPAANFSAITKFDSNGTIVWSRGISDTSSYSGMWAWSVTQTPDGSYVVGGTSSYRTLLVKFDESGSLEWTKQVTTEEPVEIRSMIKTARNGFVLCGVIGQPYGSTQSNMHIVKFDSSGTLEWTTTINSGAMSLCRSVTELKSGELIATGRRVSQPLVSSAKSDSLIIAKLTKDGEVLFTKLMQVPGISQEGAATITTQDNNVVIIGPAARSVGVNDPSGLLLMILDSNAISCNLKDIPFTTIHEGISNDVVMVIDTETTESHKLKPTNLSNISYEEIDLCELYSVPILGAKSNDFVYLQPNPNVSNGKLSIIFSNSITTDNYMFCVRSESGAIIKKEQITVHEGQNKVIIDVEECPSGMYFIDAYSHTNPLFYGLKFINIK